MAMFADVDSNDVARAVSAGFGATVAFTLFGYYAAPPVIGFPLDVAAYIADRLGDNAMLGSMVHYLAGVIAFSVSYLYLGKRVLRGHWAFRGIVWGTILWLGAMLVVFPATGGGAFMSNLVGVDAVAVSLVAHWVYGLVLLFLLRDLFRSLPHAPSLVQGPIPDSERD